MINKLTYRISKIIHGWYKPRMIYYKKNFQKKQVVNLRISNSTFIDHPQNLELNNHIYIGHFNYIEASNGIIINEGCQITSFITITTHSSHNSIRLYGHTFGDSNDQIGYKKGAVEIGKYVFVGPHSTIMPGTKIGDGCVVSAYSYISGEFPPFSIIAGNPAKVVGTVKERDNVYLEKHPELKKTYMK